MFPVYSSRDSGTVNGFAIYDVYRALHTSGSLEEALGDASVILELPAPMKSANYHSIQLDCNPSPPPETHQDDSVFFEDPDAAIVSITGTVALTINMYMKSPPVTVLMRVATVHHILERYAPRQPRQFPSPAGSPAIVPWASWRSHACILKPTSAESTLISSSRLFLHSMPRDPGTLPAVPSKLYDFNRSLIEQEPYTAERMLTPATVVKHSWLEGELPSHLPYRLTTIDVTIPPGHEYAWDSHLHGDDYMVIYTQETDLPAGPGPRWYVPFSNAAYMDGLVHTPASIRIFCKSQRPAQLSIEIRRGLKVTVGQVIQADEPFLFWPCWICCLRQ